MEAKELMIGDNVLVNNIPRKVCAITKRKIGFHLEAHETVMHYARLVEVSPLPLSSEILGKNGLATTGYWADSIDEMELIWRDSELDWTINCDEYVIMSFHYVHELQHALRLCGLKDLADNFKA